MPSPRSPTPSPAGFRSDAVLSEFRLDDEVEDASGLPGTPDGFERLWTPHRMVYIQGENKPTSADRGGLPVLRRSNGATTSPD